MSTPANFNGAKPIIDPANAAMLLIDHQSGLFQTIQDMPFTEVRTNATTLATVGLRRFARRPAVPREHTRGGGRRSAHHARRQLAGVAEEVKDLREIC